MHAYTIYTKMKRKYKRRYNGNCIGVEFGGEVTFVRLALTRDIHHLTKKNVSGERVVLNVDRLL